MAWAVRRSPRLASSALLSSASAAASTVAIASTSRQGRTDVDATAAQAQQAAPHQQLRGRKRQRAQAADSQGMAGSDESEESHGHKQKRQYNSRVERDDSAGRKRDQGRAVSAKLGQEFDQALAFARHAHAQCFDRIASRTRLTDDFDVFFEEYTYVIIASGFRASIAARLLPRMLQSAGDRDAMLQVFGNRAKVDALLSIWAQRGSWDLLRSKLTDVDSLMALPRIGPIVKHHLARNIGLHSCAKPDLHLTRYASAHGWHSVHAMIQALAQRAALPIGAADFALWLWLSHQRGVTDPDCCFGARSLR